MPKKSTCHADLHSSRIAQDEKDVAAMVDVIKNWTDPLAVHMQLSSISTVAVATTGIAEDLTTAYKVGETAYADFKKTRLESQPPTLRFNGKLKKQKLKTSNALLKTKTLAKGKDTETVLRADQNLFARMIIIPESSNLQMQDVLKHRSGPLLASLACNNGFPARPIRHSLAKN